MMQEVPGNHHTMPPDASEFTYHVQLQPGEPLRFPAEASQIVGPGHWLVSIRPADRPAHSQPTRDHTAFLNSYAPKDDGLYDEYSAG